MSSAPEEMIIEAGKAERHYWRDLWRYRELLGFLAWRDVRVRYKQAALGLSWAIIQPVVTTVIFTVLFGRLAKMPDGGVPYPLIVLSGLLAWQLFANSLGGSSGSLVANSSLISKVYFPRLIVPLAAVGVAVIDFSVVLVLFIGVSLFYGWLPGPQILLLPLFILMALAAAIGAGLWFTALTVKFRDFRFIVPFILQIGVFVTPVGFRTDFFPSWRQLMALNPMTSVVDGFRWCLLGGAQNIDPLGLAFGCGVILFTVLSGVWYFRRTEKRFADII